MTTEVINVIRKQLGSRVESFLRLYSSSIASQICGTFTAQLRHRDAAIPRLVFGGSLRRREWQWCRKSSHDDVGRSGWSSSNGTSLCAFSVVYQPTVPTYYLSAYLLTYLHTYTYILRSCGEPKPASIARICITRTCLSIALPRLVSSPRLLPSRTAKRRNEKKPSTTSTFLHLDRNEEPEIPPPSCHVALCLHWHHTGGCYSKREPHHI